jgi:PhnB protein
MQIQPYLMFNGNCEEAMEFYRRALGAEVTFLMRYEESPDPFPPGVAPPGCEKKILHATLNIGGAAIMASDDCAATESAFRGFSLSLAAADAEQAERFFNALADGGKILMPIGKTFWSPCFGMLTDRFGVGWMVTAETAEPSAAAR